MKANGKPVTTDEIQEETGSFLKAISDATEKGKALIHDSVESAKEILDEKTKDLKSRAGEFNKKTVEEVSEDLSHYVKKNPLKSVGVAFAIGAFFTYLMGPRR